MTLIADVQIAYSGPRLVQMTNGDDTTATTANLTRLQKACDIAQGWFGANTGKSYLESQASTVVGEPESAQAVAIQVVMALLYQWRGTPGDSQTAAAWQAAKDAARNYARQFGGLQWIAPVTNGNTTPAILPPTVPDFDPTRNTRWVGRDAPSTIGGPEPSSGFGPGPF